MYILRWQVFDKVNPCGLHRRTLAGCGKAFIEEHNDVKSRVFCFFFFCLFFFFVFY